MLSFSVKTIKIATTTKRENRFQQMFPASKVSLFARQESQTREPLLAGKYEYRAR